MTTDNKALAERLRKMADECEASEGLPGTFLKQCSGFVHDDLTEAARLIALREPSTPSAQVSGIDWRWQFVHTSAMRYMDGGLAKDAAERAAEQDALLIEATSDKPQGDASLDLSPGGTVDPFEANELPGMWERSDLIGGETDVTPQVSGGGEAMSAATKRRLMDRAADYDKGDGFAKAKAIGIRSAIEEIERDAALSTPQAPQPHEESFAVRVLGQERYDNSPAQAHPLQLVEEYIAELKAQQARPDGGEAVGEAGAMPGTSGFTTAVFKASDVPVGTKLYTHPTTAPDVARLVEALKGTMRPLAELAHNVNDASGFMSLGAVARHATGEVGPDYYGMAYAALEASETALAPFIAAQQESDHGPE